MAKIGILGAGAWAIALGLVLKKNGNEVTLWTCVDTEAEMLIKDREHKTSLPGIILPEDIKITMDLKEAISDMDLIIFAVASRYTRQTAAKLKKLINNGQKLLIVSKGIEDETLMTLSEIVHQELPDANVSVLSGPSHAEEASNYSGSRFRNKRDCRLYSGIVYE